MEAIYEDHKQNDEVKLLNIPDILQRAKDARKKLQELADEIPKFSVSDSGLVAKQDTLTEVLHKHHETSNECIDYYSAMESVQNEVKAAKAKDARKEKYNIGQLIDRYVLLGCSTAIARVMGTIVSSALGLATRLESQFAVTIPCKTDIEDSPVETFANPRLFPQTAPEDLEEGDVHHFLKDVHASTKEKAFEKLKGLQAYIYGEKKRHGISVLAPDEYWKKPCLAQCFKNDMDVPAIVETGACGSFQLTRPGQPFIGCPQFISVLEGTGIIIVFLWSDVGVIFTNHI